GADLGSDSAAGRERSIGGTPGRKARVPAQSRQAAEEGHRVSTIGPLHRRRVRGSPSMPNSERTNPAGDRRLEMDLQPKPRPRAIYSEGAGSTLLLSRTGSSLIRCTTHPSLNPSYSPNNPISRNRRRASRRH